MLLEDVASWTLSRPDRAGLVPGRWLRVEHRLALLPGLGVVMRCWVLRERATGWKQLVGRDLGKVPRRRVFDWHDSPYIKVSRGFWSSGWGLAG